MTEPLELRDANGSLLSVWREGDRISVYINTSNMGVYFYTTPEQWAQVTQGEWLPIDQLPDSGNFLVFMPDEPQSMRYQVMRRHPNATVIGHHFAYDLSKPSHFKVLPPPPSAALEGSK